MRKVYFLILLSTTFAAGLNAQSFRIMSATGTNITNDTVVKSGLPSDEPIEYPGIVKNISGSSKSVYVTRTYIAQPSGMTASFCWGSLCYPSFVDTSTEVVTLAAGDSSTTFRADAHPNFNTGVLLAKYVVYDINNPSDFSYVVVKFLVGTSGVEEADPSSFTLSNVYPNPAKDLINFNYEIKSGMNATIRIFDLSGKKVKEFNLNASDNSVKADISSLISGVYFYTLSLNGKAVLTKRLVVSK
jgi:hypothetical protein